MKRYARATWVAVLTLFPLTACGGSDSPSGPAGSGTMSATVNGSGWSVDSGQAQYNVSEDLIVLFAPSTGSYGMGVNLPAFAGPGTYAFENQRFATVTLGADPGWGTTYEDGEGSLTVTSFSSERITGTFQFTAYPSPSSSQTGTLVVTDGQFDLPVIPL